MESKKAEPSSSASSSSAIVMPRNNNNSSSHNNVVSSMPERILSRPWKNSQSKNVVVRTNGAAAHPEEDSTKNGVSTFNPNVTAVGDATSSSSTWDSSSSSYHPTNDNKNNTSNNTYNNNSQMAASEQIQPQQRQQQPQQQPQQPKEEVEEKSLLVLQSPGRNKAKNDQNGTSSSLPTTNNNSQNHQNTIRDNPPETTQSSDMAHRRISRRDSNDSESTNPYHSDEETTYTAQQQQPQEEEEEEEPQQPQPQNDDDPLLQPLQSSTKKAAEGDGETTTVSPSRPVATTEQAPRNPQPPRSAKISLTSLKMSTPPRNGKQRRRPNSKPTPTATSAAAAPITQELPTVDHKNDNDSSTIPADYSQQSEETETVNKEDLIVIETQIRTSDPSYSQQQQQQQAEEQQLEEQQLEEQRVDREQAPPPVLQKSSSSSSRSERVVRSYSQKPINSSKPSTRSRGLTTIVADTEENQTRGRSSGAMRNKKPGVFGRSSTSRPPTSPTPPPTSRFVKSASGKDNIKDDKAAAAAKRSWLGSFRGKPVTGKPEALVVVAPEGARSLSRESRKSAISNAASSLSEVESTTSEASKPNRPWPPQSILTTTNSNDSSSKTEEIFAIKKIVQSLNKSHEAVVTTDSADQALRELRSLQTELHELRAHGSILQSEKDKLRMELGAAQKAAAQLEALNKSYRKNQKQMLLDLQQAQRELEHYQTVSNSLNNSSADEAQRLAEELASTMAELLALQEAHQALLGSKNRPRGAAAVEGAELSGEDGADDSEHLQQETLLNLQKDLAEAMATISMLEENNETLRKQLKKRDKLEERFKRVQAERDELAAQLRDHQLALSNSVAADGSDVQDRASLVTIERLQKEKKRLLSKEYVLKEKIQKLEIKNKNQKAIFQTAVEIKHVEMKINQKERDILAHRLSEVKKDFIAAQTDPSMAEELRVLKARLQQAEAERESSMEQEGEEGCRALPSQKTLQQQMAQEIENQKIEIERLEKKLQEQEIESQKRLDDAVEDLSNQISELDQKIQKKEEEMAGLQDRSRLEAFKARRLMEEKVGELQLQLDEYEDRLINREQQIKQLDEEVRVRQSELEELKAKSLLQQQQQPQQQRRGSDRPQSSGRSDRLSELRNRLDNYETLMRSKVQNIRKMDSPTKNDGSCSGDGSSSPEEQSFLSQEKTETSLVVVEMSAASLPPAEERQEEEAVAADTASYMEKIREMEDSLQKGQAQIVELQAELATVRSQLDNAKKDLSAELEKRKSYELEAAQKSQARIAEFMQCSKESEEQASVLKAELDVASSNLTEAQSTLAKLTSEAAERNEQEKSQQIERDTLVALLAEKEESCCELQKQVEDLEKQVATANETRKSTERALHDAQAKFESMEAQLLRVSQQMAEKGDDESLSKGSDVKDDRVRSLEQELASTSAKLAEAESKCEMLEQFIHEDSQANFGGLGSSSDTLVDVVSLKEALREKEKEIEVLRSSAKVSSDQLVLARRNVEELEIERALCQAKVYQLSATLEKRGDGETEKQLHQKSLQVAEATAAKDKLNQKLQEAEAVIKRLQSELESHNGPEDRSVSSNATQLNMRLAETEVKVDILRGKLSAAEKKARELEQQNEKLSRNSREGTGAPDEMLTKMKFLEEQNAAYAATLKALRIEIATRHEGTAFE
ncbi:hypothetical protein ACA910_007851 [Epithemia clementina (nom. ined.)]